MKTTSPAYILGFMLAICTAFGTGIASVHYATLNMLIKNEKLHKNRIICRVFNLPVAGVSADAFQKAINDTITREQITYQGRAWDVYKQKDTGNIGFIFSGTGFWDRISGIMALSSDLSKVINIQFLDQKETPGLGARIEEGWFIDQFKGVLVAWDQPVDKRIIVGPAPNPNAKNRVDAITGATQTSLALMRFLNSELESFRKAIKEWREKTMLEIPPPLE
ncbi:MAG TPA: FMN-binding protein [Candidatus Wunengus sp. YC60]|uniref:FMN-binding protein n=1 Tax=Candidatus Wunengus sp. YC60 TaxID=3367697 RepID=UPI004026BB67